MRGSIHDSLLRQHHNDSLISVQVIQTFDKGTLKWGLTPQRPKHPEDPSESLAEAICCDNRTKARNCCFHPSLSIGVC